MSAASGADVTERANARAWTPGRLTRRREFLYVAKGRSVRRRGLVLQARARAHPAGAVALGPPRFGYTASRKVGSAVVRNRAKRRLREAVRTAAAAHARPGVDYVLIARRDTATLDWASLIDDFTQALKAVMPTDHTRAAR